jgi:hypothetical protein
LQDMSVAIIGTSSGPGRAAICRKVSQIHPLRPITFWK